MSDRLTIGDFTTDRLRVEDWNGALAHPDTRVTLEGELQKVLTPEVLAHLPGPLQLGSGADAGKDWVSGRAEESDVFTSYGQPSGELIGLLIVFVEEGSGHIGYLLGKDHWGKGYATELLRGLIKAAQRAGLVRLAGGVGADNPASARVLEKAGFLCDRDTSDDATNVYVMTLF